MNDLSYIKLKQTVNLQDVIKVDDENCKSKRGGTYNFGKYYLLYF